MDGWINPCRFFALASLLLATGCASLPADRGFGDVRRAVVDRRGYELTDQSDPATKNLVADLLSKALTPDSAVRVALLQNPQLRAIYARLGLASADVYEAGRLGNPRLSASVLFSNGTGEGSQVGFGLVQSFTNLLLLPSRSRFAKAEFERTKLSVASAVLDVVAQVETAYYHALGAQQSATMRETIRTAAQASADLAQRFFEAGNITALELAMEQASATQARLESLDAQARAREAHTELNQVLGLRVNEERWTLPESLATPLAREDDVDQLVSLAGTSRLDLAATRLENQLLADALGVTRSLRYVGDVEVGVETERETDGSRITGPTLGLELPIFNQGDGRVAKAQAELQRADAELQALEIEVGNQVKLAHAKVLSAKARAEQYRTALIPQREAVVARTQEEVNYMLKGQFELLLAKQQEYDAYQGYLAAVRDYWLARVQLAREVGTTLPSSSQQSEQMVEPIVPKEAPSGMGHMHHGAGGMKDVDHSGDDMEGMPGMEGMNHGASAKKEQTKKTACAQLKAAKPDDPLIQALQQKCNEEETKAPAKGQHDHSMHQHEDKPAVGKPPGDQQEPSGDHQHHH